MRKQALRRGGRALPFVVVTAISGLLFFAEVTICQASEPIIIEYSRGRNKVAIQLWKQAEDQIEKGDVANAHRNVDAALRSDPTLYPALYTRAKVYVKEHKWELAKQDCGSALRQDPTFVEAALLRAQMNSRLGHYEECIRELDHIVSIRPRLDGLARALGDRAWFRLTCPEAKFRDPTQALKDATTACKLMQWRDEDMIDTLATACAETGDFSAAVRYEEMALHTAGITPDETKVYQEHLALFQKHGGQARR